MPTFVADSGLGTNPGIQGFDSTQQSTTNFYTAIRNFNIHTTSIDTGNKAIGLNWAVSQGCSLFNVIFDMPDYSSHIGISMMPYDSNRNGEGGGSGTLISDCVSIFSPVANHPLIVDRASTAVLSAFNCPINSITSRAFLSMAVILTSTSITFSSERSKTCPSKIATTVLTCPMYENPHSF